MITDIFGIDCWNSSSRRTLNLNGHNIYLTGGEHGSSLFYGSYGDTVIINGPGEIILNDCYLVRGSKFKVDVNNCTIKSTTRGKAALDGNGTFKLTNCVVEGEDVALYNRWDWTISQEYYTSTFTLDNTKVTTKLESDTSGAMVVDGSSSTYSKKHFYLNMQIKNSSEVQSPGNGVYMIGCPINDNYWTQTVTWVDSRLNCFRWKVWCVLWVWAEALSPLRASEFDCSVLE